MSRHVVVLFVHLAVASSYEISSTSDPDDVSYDFRDEKTWLGRAVQRAAEKVFERKLKDSYLPANGELFEGDIVMDDFIRSAVVGRKTKKAASRRSRRWDNNILPYEIDGSFLPRGRGLLKEAIEEFEKRTCIRFKKRTDEADYVVYSSSENTCSSFVGRVGGRQVIHIGKDCMILGTVEHETMHALGFVHEHSRPDRDAYIKVKYDNIAKDEWINFSKYSFDQVDNEDVDYNFASVMHYRNDAFSKNGESTIEAIDEPDLKFGQRIKFSVGDIKEINKLYNCHNAPDYHGLFKDYGGKYSRRDIIKRRILKKLKDIAQALARRQ